MPLQKDVKKRYAVFIPCYNAVKTIEETLQSVEESIQYSGLDIPAFIYDDCSKDDSSAVCSNWIKNRGNFHLIKNKNNCGERKTTNHAFYKFYNVYDWVFIIHADDIVKKDWITVLVAQIEALNDEDCFTVWSSFDSLDDKTKVITTGDDTGKVCLEIKTQEQVRALLRKMYSSWHISGAAFNVSLFNKLGGFDERLAQFGDTDFFARGFLAGYKHVYISKTLTYYRIIQGSVSSVSVNTNRDINEIILLIDKHKSVFTRKDISGLYKIIRRLSLRRMVKGLAYRNFTMALHNLKQYRRFIFK
jgi:GT2 family glycosyltransferase